MNDTKRIPGIFTCGRCHAFYTPVLGYRLADANGYILELSDSEEYEKLFHEFDRLRLAKRRRVPLIN